MNFLAHIYLSGNDDDIKFGNFIGDWIKGKKFNKYSPDVQKGIILHRHIDSYTDSHPIVRESIVRLRPAYGKYAGVAVDILYDHFLAANWPDYSTQSIESYVNEFHRIIINRFGKLPKKARRFAYPFIGNKRLLCYKDLNCIEDVYNKMAIYTSMPDNTKQAMPIIYNYYDSFGKEFKSFFQDIQNYVTENNALNQHMPNSNPKG
ncbi:MAG: ACP phosphodiesterase [Bacteroidales bacterium]|nr:ACP phosphodiesterase [Bacteroidales bacterium]